MTARPRGPVAPADGHGVSGSASPPSPQVDGDIPPRVKKDAHELILDFIRSRPPLKQVLLHASPFPLPPKGQAGGSAGEAAGDPQVLVASDRTPPRCCGPGLASPTALPHPCRSPSGDSARYPRSRGPCTRRSWRRSSRSGGCAQWGPNAGAAGVSE